jgi:acyl-CoA synthetase (AMP-forming)/AMP-acid ligase II
VEDGVVNLGAALDIGVSAIAEPEVVAGAPREPAMVVTEWVLLTSGTTGEPKLVAYTLESLAGAIKPMSTTPAHPIWSTFYDIRRYGGLQIFLRAMLIGGSMLLSNPDDRLGAFLRRAGAKGVTHISGTPSHWRRVAMSPDARSMAPAYVRLSGEIVDQAILDALARIYPGASIAHAFASTEAGVAFDVGDGRAGFPATLVEAAPGGVEMKVVDGTLRIRSARTGMRYLGAQTGTLKDADGFVDTGDMVGLEGDRYVFLGRRGGVINVGGAKVFPEEVEGVINRHPAVEMSRVMARKNAFTGALVVAEVVLRADQSIAAGEAGTASESDILKHCRRELPPHKVPALVSFVTTLDVTPAGKLVRKP